MKPIKEQTQLFPSQASEKATRAQKKADQEEDYSQATGKPWLAIRAQRDAAVLTHLTSKPRTAKWIATQVGMDFWSTRHHLEDMAHRGLVNQDPETDLYRTPDEL